MLWARAPTALPGRAGLLDLRDLERHWQLRLVRVLGARVHLELAEHLPAEGVLREHALHCLLHSPLRAPGHELGVGHGAQATRIARVPVSHLVPQLVAAERHLLGIDDDDEVASVDVRREDGLVLAAQQRLRVAGQPAEYDVGRVDDMPLVLDVSSLRAECAHSHKPSRVSPVTLPAPTKLPKARESACTDRSSSALPDARACQYAWTHQEGYRPRHAVVKARPRPWPESSPGRGT